MIRWAASPTESAATGVRADVGDSPGSKGISLTESGRLSREALAHNLGHWIDCHTVNPSHFGFRSIIIKVETDMRELLTAVTEFVAIIINALALVAIMVGTLEAVFRGTHLMLSARATNHEKRRVWAHYARWLVVGLTFQLAADIIETAIAPGWDEIGRLAAIAAIRTFLNFFLERDLAEIRERNHEHDMPAKPVE
jgi:uncharacterized membrane protein